MKFVKVTDTILMISTGKIEFKHGNSPVTLSRVHHKRTQWIIRKDGLYVRKDLVDSHNLTEA
jgi:hypothetical protein